MATYEEYLKWSKSPHDIVTSSKDLSSLRDSLMSKYGNTPYAALIQNNPYSFVPTLPYGATKDYWNDLYSSYEKSAAEYYAQIQQLMLEQEYNSEGAKAARMRGAGLNPDLQGIQSASEASPFDMPMTSPGLPSSVESSNVASSRQMAVANTIFGTIESVLSAAMGFAQGLEQYRGRQYENFNLALSNKGNLMNQALDLALKEMPIDWTKPMTEGDLTQNFLKAARTVSEDRTVPKRIRRAWREAVTRWSIDPTSSQVPIGVKAKFEELRNNYAKNRNEAFSIFGNGFFSADDETMLSNFYDSIGQYSTQIEELKSKYNKDFLDLQLKYLQKSRNLSLSEKRAEAEFEGLNTSILHNQNVAGYETKSKELGLPSASASADYQSALARESQALYAKMMSDILNVSAKWKKALSDSLDKKDDFLSNAFKAALPQFFSAVDSWIGWIIPNPDKAVGTLSNLAGFIK